ncbi:hypothetical protein HDU84_006408 [Entophlyctis sp. JEL0112]|nr:hypothetical protein HDU84_006408 [Entophlyctis sp. JEL0112]
MLGSQETITAVEATPIPSETAAVTFANSPASTYLQTTYETLILTSKSTQTPESTALTRNSPNSTSTVLDVALLHQTSRTTSKSSGSNARCIFHLGLVVSLVALL